MEMFISFTLNEIIDQQSDPENIRDKSLFGCRAELPHRTQGGAERPLMHFIMSCVRSDEKAATSVVCM